MSPRATLALLATFACASALAQDAARSDKRLFSVCVACHALDPADRGAPAPHLAGVLNRPAASLPGVEYSDALRAAGRAGLVWDRATLERWLADPEALVPGTAMAGVRVARGAERRAIIDLLERGMR